METPVEPPSSTHTNESHLPPNVSQPNTLPHTVVEREEEGSETLKQQQQQQQQQPPSTHEVRTPTSVVEQCGATPPQEESCRAVHMSHTGLELSSKQSSNGGVSRKNGEAKTVRFSEEVGGLADTQSNRESEKRANSTRTAQVEDHQIEINGQSDEHRLNHTYRLTIKFKLIFVNNVLSTNSKGVAVLGHYSPKLLRDEEEVDVKLDESSASPRYSWLFPDKVNCCFLFFNQHL